MKKNRQQHEVTAWLQSYPPRTDISLLPGLDATPLEHQERIFKGLICDLQMAIDEFGYEAVYFGVGCEVFPDAVDPGVAVTSMDGS